MRCLCQAVNDFLRAAQSLTPHVVVRPETLFAAINQASIAQDTQVMRNGRLLQRKALNDLEDANFAFITAEQAQNTQACGIGQRLQQAGLRNSLFFSESRRELGRDPNSSARYLAV